MYAAEIGAAVIERSSTPHPTPPATYHFAPPLYTPKKPIDQGSRLSLYVWHVLAIHLSFDLRPRRIIRESGGGGFFGGPGNRCMYRGYRRRMGREGHPPSSNFPYARGRGGGHRKFNLDIFSGLLHPLSFIRMDTVSGKKFLAQNTEGFPESDPLENLLQFWVRRYEKKKNFSEIANLDSAQFSMPIDKLSDFPT